MHATCDSDGSRTLQKGCGIALAMKALTITA
jgi:hypothetical protein